MNIALHIAENMAYVCVWKGSWALLEHYTTSEDLWIEYATIGLGACAVLLINKISPL